MIGETLKGRYRVESKLGSGAMGVVYRATDLKTQEYVAIKTMSADIAQDERYRKRFVREATALQKLKHPNIVGYVDTFGLGEGACLVMEYYGGGTLESMIKGSEGGLPDGTFKRVALAIIDAIASAHEAGVIHRDLKPANILLTANGVPKIADFGLAKNTQLSTMTKTGTAIGTLVYMPPEAFDALAKQDQRGDIWSLGVILFEMLTGMLPFRARNDTQIIAAILNDPPLSLYTYRKDIPAAWVSIIDHCLEKEPTYRYQSARELHDDLRADRANFALGSGSQDLQDYVNLLDNRLGGNPEPAAGMVAITPETERAEGAKTEILSGSVMPSEPMEAPEAAKQDYQYAFIQRNAPAAPSANTVRPAPKQPMPGKPIRSLSDLTAGQAPTSRQRTMGMYVMGGLLSWLGMLTMLLTSFFSFYVILDLEYDAPVLPRVMLLGTGALFFFLGTILEVPESDGMNRVLLLSMGFGGIIIAVVGGLAAATEFFIFALMAAVLALAVMLMYLGVKGF